MCVSVCVSSRSQKCNLSQPVWNFLVITSEVICHVSPLAPRGRSSNLHDKSYCNSPPPKKRCWPQIILFLLEITSLPHPPSVQKLQFVSKLLKHLSACQIGCFLISESLNKAKDSQFTWLNFCFLTVCLPSSMPKVTVISYQK